LDIVTPQINNGIYISGGFPCSLHRLPDLKNRVVNLYTALLKVNASLSLIRKCNFLSKKTCKKEKTIQSL